MLAEILPWIHQQLDMTHRRDYTIGAMEGLRGVAVILVFFVHYSAQIKLYINPETLTGLVLPYIEMAGNIGVDLFFVLSGYLIYGALIKQSRLNWYQYARRRFKRIYPTFAAVFGLYLLLTFTLSHKSKLPNDTADAVILIVQNALLMPGLFDVVAINSVTWSLSYEVWFYAIIPIAITMTRMRYWLVNTRIIFWIVITVVLAMVLTYFDGPKRMLMFISGILLLECHRHQLKIKLSPFIGVVCLLFAAIFYGLKRPLDFSGIWPVLMLYVLFFVFCFEALTSDVGTSKLLNYRLLRYLGNMSFSYYLIHSLALKALFFAMAMRIHPAKQFEWLYWWAMVPMFLITCVISLVLFVLVERRFLDDRISR